MQGETNKKAAAGGLASDVRELPDWLTETTEFGYELEQWDEVRGGVQTIKLTREEYIALKLHLAKMRGIAVPEVAHA